VSVLLGLRVAGGLLEHGLAARLQRAWPSRLTVLTYHRIADPRAPTFKGLAANVSATPDGFAAQLTFLRRWFNVVSLGDVVAWLEDGRPLPQRAALITFDDGYRDNHDAAWPVLRAQGLPAALFVATGCIGSTEPFWWDLVAYAFERTRLAEADLPLLGLTPIGTPDAREQALRRWLQAAKALPSERVSAFAETLVERLEVDVPAGTFADNHLDWERLRMMAADTFAIGAHTETHPALAQTPPDRARLEIRCSRARLEEELGRPVRTFAYPFGGAHNFAHEHEVMLREEGFAAAFSLLPGPLSYDAARRHRMRIRRINVSRHDDFPRFALKLLGMGRVRRI
jgi:peptidoglycan/xylan/chitin deacetylase (PgdA/CDA1 family)